jgi:hypothetical protein
MVKQIFFVALVALATTMSGGTLKNRPSDEALVRDALSCFAEKPELKTYQYVFTPPDEERFTGEFLYILHWEKGKPAKIDHFAIQDEPGERVYNLINFAKVEKNEGKWGATMMNGGVWSYEHYNKMLARLLKRSKHTMQAAPLEDESKRCLFFGGELKRK